SGLERPSKQLELLGWYSHETPRTKWRWPYSVNWGHVPESTIGDPPLPFSVGCLVVSASDPSSVKHLRPAANPSRDSELRSRHQKSLRPGSRVALDLLCRPIRGVAVLPIASLVRLRHRRQEVPEPVVAFQTTLCWLVQSIRLFQLSQFRS